MDEIKSKSLSELTEEIEKLGEAKFRAKQIYEWIHVKLVKDFDDMSNISAALKAKLKENYSFNKIRAERVQESKIDGTKKFLFELEDGNFVESV